MSIDIIIGDMHFGRKNNSRERHSDTLFFIDKFLTPIIQKITAQASDVKLVFTGDMFDSKQVIETFISNDCYFALEELSHLLPIDFFVGNHDLLSRTDDMVYNSTKTLKYMNNINLYEEFTVVGDVAYMPFYKNKLDEIAFIESCEAPYLYSHTEYSGFYYEGKMIEESPKSINPDLVKKFKRVINGHIHGRQEKGNLLIVGTPYQLKYGEYKNIPHIHIFDRTKNKIQAVENKMSPRFKIFHFFNFLNKTVDQGNAEIKNNYCKIITPGELFDKIDVNKIVGSLDGSAKELEFEPVRTVKRDDIPTSDGEDDLKISSVIDIRVKYDNFITDSIDIDGAMISDELKERLKTDFREMYAEAETRVNINDLEFS